MRFSEASSACRPSASTPTLPPLWNPGRLAAEPGCGPSDRGKRVLIVDDEADVLLGLSAMLEKAGFVVTTANSVSGAIAVMRRETFQLVLTDLYLGETELGVQIAEVARERRPNPPVIVLGSKILNRLEVKREGSSLLLSKPY